jgi:hypothetical protein
MMRPLAAAAILGVILLALAVDPAVAQPQQMTPIATPPAAAEAPKPVTPVKHRRWLKADARVCLEFPTDMQVIKCSENYR